jgi:anion-transporting  ArsA/GET3 family ATPase
MRDSKQQLQAYNDQVLPTVSAEAQMQQLQVLLQWKAEQEYAMQQQQQAHFQAMQQQQQMAMHSSHLDADDLRSMIERVRPGEKISVKRYEGFEINHQQQTDPTKGLIVVCLIIGFFVGMVMWLSQ